MHCNGVRKYISSRLAQRPRPRPQKPDPESSPDVNPNPPQLSLTPNPPLTLPTGRIPTADGATMGLPARRTRARRAHEPPREPGQCRRLRRRCRGGAAAGEGLTCPYRRAELRVARGRGQGTYARTKVAQQHVGGAS